jgi:hypothetical protein
MTGAVEIIKETLKKHEGDAMKTLATIIGTLAGFAPAAAFAATTGNTESTGLLGIIFMGFGALIVVGQIVPVILMMTGLVKGATAKEAKNEA